MKVLLKLMLALSLLLSAQLFGQVATPEQADTIALSQQEKE
jgi:hypothetical protein